MLPAMEPEARPPFPPVQAGFFLASVTLLTIGAGALIGWIFGSLKAGLIVGAVLGVPAGVAGVYFRYRSSLA
jgi:hypothetical protein